MVIPKETLTEADRLKDLESYKIMDSKEEEDFDRITELASQICGTKISLVSLIDDKRQWFKSRKGLEVGETPKEIAFCAHAIQKADEPLIVEDTKYDERFADNPLVTDEPNISFYAGVPLVSSAGYPLGTLCVIHDEPKKLSDEQLNSLTTLANQTMKLIELRKVSNQLKSSNKLLVEQNSQLKLFTDMAAHDLKSPLSNIYSLSKLALEDETLDSETREYLELIDSSSSQMLQLIEDLLNYRKNSNLDANSKETIDLKKLIEELKELLPADHPFELSLQTSIEELIMNRVSLKSILSNLLSNAIRYNDKEKARICLNIWYEKGQYHFEIEDNGPGIDTKFVEKIFEPFATLQSTDNQNLRGSGLGLAGVKKMVENLGGVIKLDPKYIYGSKFVFSIPK
jgi:signal transduction histidine kinase